MTPPSSKKPSKFAFWNRKALEAKPKQQTKEQQKSETGLIRYETWRQNWIVFKFIIRLFFSDYIGVFVVIIFPILISALYLILYKTDIFKESLFGQATIPGITTVKIWFEFLMYTIGFAAFIYMAVSIADIKHTILFKKMVSGFTTKSSLLILFFILYFFLAFLTVLLKFAILAFYPTFRNVVLSKFNWGIFILGVLFFITTNLSLGMLFSSFKIGAKGVLPVSIITFFVFLFFAGLWVAPAGVEMLFLIESRENAFNFLEVSDTAKIWRAITLFSPLQPGLKMIEAGTENGKYGVEWIVTQFDAKEGEYLTRFIRPPTDLADKYYAQIGSTQSSDIKAHLLYADFAEFKQKIATDTGFAEWKAAVKKYFERTYGANINTDLVKKLLENSYNFLEKIRKATNAGHLVNVKMMPFAKFGGELTWSFTLTRPMFYTNSLTPALINLGWLVGLNSLTFFLWKTNRVV